MIGKVDFHRADVSEILEFGISRVHPFNGDCKLQRVWALVLPSPVFR